MMDLFATPLIWIATFAVFGLAGLLDGGLDYWLQDAIYLVAAVPFAKGVTGFVTFKRQRQRSAYRRGVYYIVVAWAIATHGWLSVRAHREQVAAHEQALTPVITGLARYHELHGEYPRELSLLDESERAPLGVRFAYVTLDRDSYVLSFTHNVFMDRRYSPRSGGWQP